MKNRKTVTAHLDAKSVKTILASLKGDNDKKSLLLFSLGFYTGFRISDILQLTWEQLRNDKLEVIERKTKKLRTVIIAKDLRSIIKFCDNEQTGFCFVSERHHTQKAMTVQGANKLIKRVFERYAIEVQNASSHTFRKTFAMQMYNRLGSNDKALSIVSKMLNHSKTETTLKYLNLSQRQINNCYENFTF